MKCLVLLALVAACYAASPYVKQGGIRIRTSENTIDVSTPEKQVIISSQVLRQRLSRHSRNEEATVILVRDQDVPTRQIVINKNNQIVQDTATDLGLTVLESRRVEHNLQFIMLKQLFTPFLGEVDQSTLRQLLNQLEVAVETGTVNPIILEVLSEVQDQQQGQTINVDQDELNAVQPIALLQLIDQIGEESLIQVLRDAIQQAPLTSQQQIMLQQLRNVAGSIGIENLLAIISNRVSQEKNRQIMENIINQPNLITELNDKQITLLQKLINRIGVENSREILMEAVCQQGKNLREEAQRKLAQTIGWRNAQELTKSVLAIASKSRQQPEIAVQNLVREQTPIQWQQGLQNLVNVRILSLLEELINEISEQEAAAILTEAIEQSSPLRQLSRKRLVQVIGVKNAQELVRDLLVTVDHSNLRPEQIIRTVLNQVVTRRQEASSQIFRPNWLTQKQLLLIQQLINRVGPQETSELLTKVVIDQGILNRISEQKLIQVIGWQNTQEIIKAAILVVSQGQQQPQQAIQSLVNQLIWKEAPNSSQTQLDHELGCLSVQDILEQNLQSVKEIRILQRLIDTIGEQRSLDILVQTVQQPSLARQIALKKLTEIIGVQDAQQIVRDLLVTVSQTNQQPEDIIRAVLNLAIRDQNIENREVSSNILGQNLLTEKQNLLIQQLINRVGAQETSDLLTKTVIGQGVLKRITEQKLVQVIGWQNAQEIIKAVLLVVSQEQQQPQQAIQSLVMQLIREEVPNRNQIQPFTVQNILVPNLLPLKELLVLQELVNRIGDQKAVEILTQTITQPSLLRQVALRQLAEIIGVQEAQELVRYLLIVVNQTNQPPTQIIRSILNQNSVLERQTLSQIVGPRPNPQQILWNPELISPVPAQCGILIPRLFNQIGQQNIRQLLTQLIGQQLPLKVQDRIALEQFIGRMGRQEVQILISCIIGEPVQLDLQGDINLERLIDQLSDESTQEQLVNLNLEVIPEQLWGRRQWGHSGIAGKQQIPVWQQLQELRAYNQIPIGPRQ